MKLSIVILCWNDLRVIGDCLQSIYSGTHDAELEIIISDNGSTDGCIDFIRKTYPQVRLIENGTNLRFAKGNNVAIQAAIGEYILILNPDTIIHPGSLDKFLEFADRHPEAGAFACRVVNTDGSYQESARPFPTIRGDWVAALYLRKLAYLSDYFISDTYTGWNGDTGRRVDWQAGCCILLCGKLLKEIGGFDEQFFYYYEDVDLCRRVWEAGSPILYTPEATITHIGGQSTKRFPLRFELDKQLTRYRYYYKYYGKRGVRRCRWVSLAWYVIRYGGYGIAQLLMPTQARSYRLQLYRAGVDWNLRVDPIRVVENGEVPRVGQQAVVDSA